MNIFEEYELYKAFTDLYYFLEDAAALTLEEERNMVSEECSEFDEADRKDAESLYYKYKCFYSVAQICPKDERRSFFCELAIKELQGSVAVDFREAKQTGKKPRIVAADQLN